MSTVVLVYMVRIQVPTYYSTYGRTELLCDPCLYVERLNRHVCKYRTRT